MLLQGYGCGNIMFAEHTPAGSGTGTAKLQVIPCDLHVNPVGMFATYLTGRRLFCYFVNRNPPLAEAFFAFFVDRFPASFY